MTKERLRNYRAEEREAAQIAARIAEIENRLYSPKAPKLTGMPHSQPNGDALAELVAKRAELLAMYTAKQDWLYDELLAVEAAIGTLPPHLRVLMRYRYIDGLRWEAICGKMNYSWQQIHNLHRRALDILRTEGE